MDRADVVARDRARRHQRVPRGGTARAGEAGHPLDRRVPRLRGWRLVGLHRIRRLRRRPRMDGVRARLTPRGGGGARRGRAGRPRRRTPTARRGQVPAARGAEPGRHVHGVARSGGWAVDLRQPPAPGPARIRARGPARRSRLVVGTRPSRRPRRCAGREPDRLLAGHPVRPDVPDANGGRNVGLGAGRGSPDPGRRRPDPLLAGLPRRRDRTRRDRGAAPRGRGSVPGDGRADPGGDLHRSRRPRRRDGDGLREPADREHPRVSARTVPGAGRPVVRGHASRSTSPVSARSTPSTTPTSSRSSTSIGCVTRTVGGCGCTTPRRRS